MFLQEAAGLRKQPRGKLVGVISQAIGVRRNNILLTNAYIGKIFKWYYWN